MTIDPELQVVTLKIDGASLEFKRVGILFKESSNSTSIFSRKNNKSLLKTVQHPKYSSLRHEAEAKYREHLDAPLGEFLFRLKNSGDPFYQRFLNKHGDLEYCEFALESGPALNSKGLYLFRHGGSIRYLGRCRDSFKKRFNSGYGKIAPKNCFLDGQSTNCRINALVAIHRNDLSIHLCPLGDDDVIARSEACLIQELHPEWNLAVPW